MYEAIRTVKNTATPSQQACIKKDKNGFVLDQQVDILERWREYGQELFERPEGEEPQKEIRVPLEQQEPPPLLSEVELAVKHLKSGKAAGIDAIPAELVKNTGPTGIKFLHQLCMCEHLG